MVKTDRSVVIEFMGDDNIHRVVAVEYDGSDPKFLIEMQFLDSMEVKSWKLMDSIIDTSSYFYGVLDKLLTMKKYEAREKEGKAENMYKKAMDNKVGLCVNVNP